MDFADFNLNRFEKLEARGLFSFLVKYLQTFIRAASVAFVANGIGGKVQFDTAISKKLREVSN